MKKINIAQVKNFIDAQGPDTKVYLGADSERIRIDDVWYADYTLAIVVHVDGRHGCKIFGEVQREKDFDHKKNKPSMRLMTEVMKVSELFLSLQEAIGDKHIEVHLDLNPNEMHGSSCVVQQAVGYVKGVCNVTPVIKPKAFAASYAADRLKYVLAN